ncbi:MAG: DUF4258 domain-containing protein [Dehalococcoidia bacterium]
MPDQNLVFRVHVIERMAQWRVNASDVRHVLETGEVVEDYPDSWPYPSRLVLGHANERPLHVVAAYREDTDELIVITVYEPDPARWEPGFRQRKTP